MLTMAYLASNLADSSLLDEYICVLYSLFKLLINLFFHIIKTFSPQAQMCVFNFVLQSVWSRLLEIFCPYDGGMHSTTRGRGLNGGVVSIDMQESRL